MGALLPPSRLLRATIVAMSVVLAIKVVALAIFAPPPGLLWKETTQAAMTASVIADAHAAGPGFPATSPVTSAQPAAPGNTVNPPAVPPADPPQAPHVDAGSAAQDINLHRSQIEEREQRVAEREAAAAAVEKRLTDRANELLAIQSHLEGLLKENKEQDDAKWAGLVKLYEGMRPRDAAAIFDGLDKPVLLEIVARMRPAKASAVIALMLPDNARQVTADLAAKRNQPAAATN